MVGTRRGRAQTGGGNARQEGATPQPPRGRPVTRSQLSTSTSRANNPRTPSNLAQTSNRQNDLSRQLDQRRDSLRLSRGDLGDDVASIHQLGPLLDDLPPSPPPPEEEEEQPPPPPPPEEEEEEEQHQAEDNEVVDILGAHILQGLQHNEQQLPPPPPPEEEEEDQQQQQQAPVPLPPNCVHVNYQEEDDDIDIIVGKEVVSEADGSITLPVKSIDGTAAFGRQGILLEINGRSLLTHINERNGSIGFQNNAKSKAVYIKYMIHYGTRPLRLTIRRVEGNDTEVISCGENNGRHVMIQWNDGEQPSKGKVHTRLPNGNYLIDKHNEVVTMKEVSIDDIQFGWPDEDDYYLDDTDPGPTQLHEHQNWSGIGVPYRPGGVGGDHPGILTCHDPDYRACCVFRQLGEGVDFDMEDILRKQTGGAAAADRYAQLVLNNVNDPPKEGVINFGLTRVLNAYGHRYLIMEREVGGVLGSCAGKCSSQCMKVSCPARFDFDNSTVQRTFTVTHSDHNVQCKVGRFLSTTDEPLFTLALKRAVALEYLKQWEQIYSLDVRVLVCVFECIFDSISALTATLLFSITKDIETWHIARYIKTYMNFDQLFRILKHVEDGNEDEAIRLLKLGNDVEDGYELHPDKFYFISTYGRFVQVKPNGKIELLGSIGKDQYIRLQLLCRNKLTLAPKWIGFSLHDLVDKHYNGNNGLPLSLLRMVSDHLNGRRRSNHKDDLRGERWAINSGQRRLGVIDEDEDEEEDDSYWVNIYADEEEEEEEE